MSGRRWVAAGILGVAGCLALVSPAAGQTSQPQTAPGTQPTTQPAATVSARPSPFRLSELIFDLGFEAGADGRSVTQDTRDWFPRQFRQTDRDRRFEETVGAQASGSLFGEQVMLYDLAARWGLVQEHFTETGTVPDEHQRSHGELREYDLRWTLFPRGTVSAGAYATLADSRVPRAFLPSLDRTLEKYGADVYVHSRTLPMRFSFEHVWDELTSRTHRLEDDEERGRDAFQYEGTWQISETQALRLQYEHEQREELYSGSGTRFDTTRDFAVLNHTLRFGPEGRSSLETLARFQDERGDLARDIAEGSTRLRLQLTDALAGTFGAQALHESFQDLSTDTYRGEAGLAYQLGEAFTSALQLYGLRQSDDEQADFTEWGAVATGAYARDNALGRFSANLSFNHAATDTSAGAQRGIVIGESITFHDPLAAYLVKMDVERFSLVVTDAGRSRTYLPGRDYQVVTIGRYTALTRVPTGQIADRQTVLVSYTYRVSSDYELRRDRVDFRVQQDFKFGLLPYYAASIQNEDLDSTQPESLRARNVNRHRLGATFRQPRWSLGAEYEYNDDGLDPYQAMHFNGDVVVWQRARHQLDGKGTFSRFWFDGSGDLAAHDTSLLDLGASYRYLIAESVEASVGALYRYEDDTQNGLTRGVDLTAGVEWKLGLFSLRFEAEYDVLDLPGSDDDSFSVWLKLKREIPVIARAEP